MIKLTRLGGRKFVLNAELIKTVEETPDTVLALTTGEKLLVADSVDEVVAKVLEYKRQIRIFPD